MMDIRYLLLVDKLDMEFKTNIFSVIFVVKNQSLVHVGIVIIVYKNPLIFVLIV